MQQQEDCFHNCYSYYVTNCIAFEHYETRCNNERNLAAASVFFVGVITVPCVIRAVISLTAEKWRCLALVITDRDVRIMISITVT